VAIGSDKRLAVLSDFHGSLAALEAVVSDLRQTSPDLVLQAGDLAVNGPHPNEVVTWIRELGWAGVVGNTDEMLWRPELMSEQIARMPKLEPLLRVLYQHTAPATRDRLADDNLAWLQTLPERHRHGDIAIVHASPGDLWRAPGADSDEQAFLAAYDSLEAQVVVYGHLHRPFVRELERFTVANSGSVGLTWDGDPRASYLLIDGTQAQIRRVEYDVERDVSALRTSNYPYALWLAEMRRLGSYSPPATD
jgi:putative phosphoesterase